MDDWLARLRHDLVKRAVWRARDLRELSVPPRGEDLLALRRGLLELRDDEGRAVGARDLWRARRAEVEGTAPAAALDDFGRAVDAAEAAARALDPAGSPGGSAAIDSAGDAVRAILDLEPAFDALQLALGGAGGKA